VTLGKLIAESAKYCEEKVTLYPIKGMAQRGGVITTYVRIGKNVSPIIPEGYTDVIISLETSECLKCIAYLKRGGILLLNKRAHIPQSIKRKEYPSIEDIQGCYSELTTKIMLFDPQKSGEKEGGGVLHENIALLGMLSAVMDHSEYLKPGILKKVIKNYFSSHVEENINSFIIGYQSGKNLH